MSASLGVGLLGVDPDHGWARESHVPALAHLPGLDLVAVGSRHLDRAQRAATAFGAARAHGSAAELIADPAVDVVAVATSVPAHRELIVAAAEAGKHVYSEWPLAVDRADAEEIAAVVARTGVRSAVGLQARTSPAVVAAARLVADGAIGRPLSASVLSTTAGFGRVVAEGEFYLEDPATGMHLVTIQLAHTVDLVERVLGPVEASPLFTTQFPVLAVGDPVHDEARTLPDHVLLQGRVGDGVPLAVEVAGGRPPERTPFRMEVVGERATLSLVGGAPRGVQAGTLTVLLDGDPQPVDDVEVAGLSPSATNVASVYAALRDDVAHGTRTAPDVDHALRLTRLVDDLRRLG